MRTSATASRQKSYTSFSVLPLKLATYLGLCVASFAVVFGAQLILRTLLFGNPVAGYPSLMVVILFMGGAQLVFLGIIGEYLGRIFNETKTVLGLMPHPENAIDKLLGSVDGRGLFKGLAEALS